MTEPLACPQLGQARNPQLRKAGFADDEPQLVKRIGWMGGEYGRHTGHHVKSYRFVMNRTADCRADQMLMMLDQCTRECVVIDVSRKRTSDDVLE